MLAESRNVDDPEGSGKISLVIGGSGRNEGVFETTRLKKTRDNLVRLNDLGYATLSQYVLHL